MSNDNPQVPSSSGDQPDPQDFLQMLAAAGIKPEDLEKAGLPKDPTVLHAMFQQAQQMFAGASDTEVNWSAVENAARHRVSADGDSSISLTRQQACRSALRTAEVWLDAVTDFPALTSGRAESWSKSEWIVATMPTWRRLAQPVAASVSEAVSNALADASQELPPEMSSMMSGLMGSAGSMMRHMGNTMFGMQIGQALGTLAGEVMSAHDIGLPLVKDTMALVPSGVTAFGEQVPDVPADEVLLYLALREAATARLYTHVPWLAGQVMADVEAFAAGIHVDADAIGEIARQVQDMDPHEAAQQLSNGFVEPPKTPAQQAALSRLEDLLALIEGWVDVTVREAATHLPAVDRLQEAMRRRRAVGGPAEHILAALVGLHLRPRRLRDAAHIWRMATEHLGTSGRDHLWSHPDLMPTSDDLDKPGEFALRCQHPEQTETDWDAELSTLLGNTDGKSSGAAEPGPGAS